MDNGTDTSPVTVSLIFQKKKKERKKERKEIVLLISCELRDG